MNEYRNLAEHEAKIHSIHGGHSRAGSKAFAAGNSLTKSRTILFSFVFMLLVGVAGGGRLYAQFTSGSLTGVVYDPNSAVVAGCTVTATSVTTGFAHSVQTNALGDYTMPSLPPDQYAVTATAVGFKVLSTQATVSLGQASRFDFHLELGSTSQSVSVNASTSELELQKESHEVGTLLGAQTVENLPSNGRNVFQTLLATATANPYTEGDDSVGAFGLQANMLTIGGTTYGTTSYLQDGVNNFNMVAKSANLQPSIEAVEEVNVIQNGASARFDEPSVVNVITKGGTNSFHGRAYDYLRNTVLNAEPYFKAPKPAQRYNQFGANIGGPIIRNKLFFFGDYSGLRSNQGLTLFAVVPTTAEKSGDFSGDNFTIYDPLTFNAQTNTISAFPGNKIPANRISNFANLYLPYYPAPTGSSIQNVNYQRNDTSTETYNSYLGRLDYQIAANDMIYGAYETTNPHRLSPNFTTSAIFNLQTIQDARNAYVQETHTFGSNMVNIARFGYNYSDISVAPQGAGADNYVTQYGLQNLNPQPSQYMPPVVSLPAHSSIGYPNFPNGATQSLYEGAEEIDRIVGRHSIFLGVEMDQINMFRFSADWPNGQYTFTGQYTSDHGVGTGKLTGGQDIADLLLEYPTAALGGSGNTTGHFPQLNFFPYIQDDWKITKKLVLNLGLRYDYWESPASSNSSVYDVTTNITHPGTYHQNYLNIAPRLGFAYSINDTTVVHGGYGIYYAPFEYQVLTFLLVHAPNFLLQSNTYPLATPTPATNTFVANPPASSMAPFTTSLVMPTPYVQQWNLAVQRSLGSNWVTSLAYLGSKYTHQQLRYNPNQARVPSGPNDYSSLSSRRPYPYVGDVLGDADIGYANYNGLEAALERRFSNGLSVLSNYVWSKALDAGSSGASPLENGLNIAQDYGLSELNSAQVFKLSSVYELPIGQGKPFLSGGNWVGRTLIGGWSASGTLIVRSGLPFNTYAKDLSNTGGDHGQRANRVCNGNHVTNQSKQEWFNTACYVQPGVGQLGNEGRNDLIGPRNTNLDASFFKNFNFSGDKFLQFRSDFFNSFNHPQLGTPSNNVSVPTFGQITSVGGSRVIQLSLKLSY